MTRLTGHSSDDQQTKYRSEEELAEQRAQDPLPRFRDELRAAGVLAEAAEAALAAEVAAAVDDATAFAEAAPDPDPATLLRHVYAERAGRPPGAPGVAFNASAPGQAARVPPAETSPEARRVPPAPPRGRLMPVRTFIEAIREGLRDEMRRDERVIVLGEDVGRKGGVFYATDGLWAEFGDDRVIDTPLTESMIAGVSIGAAANGLLPVAEIQFADFIFPAMNQIISEAARIRYRSNGTFGCPITIRAPYGAGVHGALYHSQSVEAFFAHVPGLKVVIPSTPYDAKGLLRTAIRDPDPVIFLEHKKMYRSVRGEVPDGEYTVPFGRAAIPRTGSRLTIVAYGLMLHYALEAAARVAEEGIEAEVIDLRTIRPLDEETILASVRRTGKCLVVHEDNRFGGFGAEVAALVAEEAFDYLDGPVTRLAGPDSPASPNALPLEEAFMLSPAKIAAAIRTLAAY